MKVRRQYWAVVDANGAVVKFCRTCAEARRAKKRHQRVWAVTLKKLYRD